MTAAHRTRCVYLTSHGEPRGHAADTAHPPHESGPRITVPLFILSGMAIVAGFANIPNSGALSWVPDGMAVRLEHFYEPTGDYFPVVLATFAHPEFRSDAHTSELHSLMRISYAVFCLQKKNSTLHPNT